MLSLHLSCVHLGARGEFKMPNATRSGRLRSSPSTPLFVETRQRSVDLKSPSLTPSPSAFFTSNISASTAAAAAASGGGLSSGATTSGASHDEAATFGALGSGVLLREFYVERLHRLKPRWAASLAIRDDCLELVPMRVERRLNLLTPATQKCVAIAWDLIGGVEYADRSHCEFE